MLSSLLRRCSTVIPKPRKLGNILFSVRPRALQSRSYATKIKSARASAVEAEKSKENKAVNLLTDEQTDLLSLSSPTTQARLVELCSQSKQFDVIKKLFIELMSETTMKVHLMKLLTQLGEIEVENITYDKEIIQLADLAIKKSKLGRKEAALVLLKIFLWRGRMDHVLELLQQLERIGVTITENLYYEVLRLGLHQQKYEFMNLTFQEMFSKGIKPSPLTYSLMARGYAAAGKKDLALVLIDKIQLTDYNIDIIYNLIFMHCLNGDTFKAINLLDALLKHPGSVSEKEEIKVWKAIFLSFRSVRPPMNIVNDVVKMAESRNFKFMDEIYLGVMRSLPDVKYVEEFVHSVKKRNRYVPSNVWMEVITMQAQRGFYNASLFTWKEMMEYGVEITKKRCEQMIGLAQYVKRSEARFTFQRMRELVFEPMKKLPDDQKPDAHTYNMMIKAALLMKRPAKALELWDEIDALKLPLNTEEKMITRKEVEEISELKQTFEKDKKNSMESLNPLTRGVNFERTDVVVIAELIRHYLKEYSDSRSVAAWDSLPPKNLDRYFTLTERQIIQQKGIDLNSLPTVFDRKAPVIQFSSQKQEVVEEVPKEETPKTGESFSQVFNQDDFDEVWMLDDNKNEEENESKETASEVKPQEPQQSNEEIIAKNSEITPQSRNFKGVAFSPAGSWRSFFFVYNRLVGEGFGYTLAQAKEDMRIKMLDPNSKFFTYIKERITEEEFKHLLKVYSASRKYNKYSVFWKKIQRTPEERQANREHRTKLEKESQKAKEERKKEALEKQRLKKDKEADPTQLIK